MRPTHTQTIFLSLLLPLAVAHPYPRDDFRDVGFGYLMPRDCDSYCGSDNQYCCSNGQTCTTSAGIAGCAATGAGGEYDFYTTTWTETKTYTSTISSFLGPTTAASGGNGEPCVPPEGSGEIACGTICCATWQYCAHDGQCLPNAGSGSWTQWTTVGVVTTQYSAPYRVTSGSTIVQTSASTTTGTAASETASSTSTGAPAPVASTSGSLSGGAIAGIVVGTIAGVVLLLLLCFCCIVRGLWEVVAGIFGFGGRRRKETERIEVTEEHYSRRGSRHGSTYGAAAARPVHRTWFGGGGGRPASSAARKEKRSSGGNWGWLAAGAGAAALLLGLRRDDRRRASSQKPPRSDWGSSYYTDSYTASSPSSQSSDRRTRDTRRSRQSRATRASRPSRASRHSRS
ncbi:uncharacterized protein F4822DRAFT_334144 [Hypoxylon trugodes]|uniref:uncharacterized protein n=1 Tax=Hypoxylon trugodes TaxID=326681 RepID=UPI0021981211|nr:uncharacterized protein F4822DRAFT_334144 [Hypoxylon trugodes]KAI1387093.1 hypothetical protein F4822DRAFT_334144 [Hypoxylon trugodes]